MMNNDTEGRLYDRPASERVSTNRMNAKLAKEYMDLKSAKEKNDIYGQAREQGIREGSDSAYADVMERLAASDQYRPIMEGSPEDVYMQEGVNRGLAYTDPEGPSFADEVGNKLNGLAKGVSDWFTQGTVEPEQQSQLQKDQEQEQLRHESEQAGLNELKQILNRQQP